MFLVDKEIRVFLSNGTLQQKTDQTSIYDGSDTSITNIGYDLVSAGFVSGTKLVDSYDLHPGSSVFVESVERIFFDFVTCGIVQLKNSRIRMGLTLDAPVYQPGHETKIYFRLTNLSEHTITLTSGEKYACLLFQQLHDTPDAPYSGTFQGETSYKGLGDYDVYKSQMRAVEQKKMDLQSMEKNIYTNVITILTIFIAVFSLINLNLSLAEGAVSAAHFIVYNFSLLGAVSFLVLLLHELLQKHEKRFHLLWILPVVCFLIVILSGCKM